MTSFQDQTWKEARDAFDRGLVVILPIGSTEAHGPHLPLATDVIISQEMAHRAVSKLAAREINALVLPPIAYSVTDFSSDFPGTVSIKRATATAIIRDVCASLYEQGARLVVIANSHLEPDHIASINDAIEQVQRETGRAVSFPDKRKRLWAQTLNEEFRRGDCHAGSYETSLVMASKPELVRNELQKNLERVPISIAEKIKEGARSFKEAGGTEAYFGDPRSATQVEGNSLFEALSDMLVASVLESLESETREG